MSIETDLRASLLAHPPLAALVQDRIALSAAAEGWPMPYVVYRTRHAPEYTLTGHLSDDTVTVQLQAWASTAAQALAVADEIEAALHLRRSDSLVTERDEGFDDATLADYASVGAIVLLTYSVPDMTHDT